MVDDHGSKCNTNQAVLHVLNDYFTVFDASSDHHTHHLFGSGWGEEDLETVFGVETEFGETTKRILKVK